MADRPAWDYAPPTKAYEQPFPDQQRAVVRYDGPPNALVSEMQEWTPGSNVQVDLASEESSLTDTQLDMAGQIGDASLESWDCPDPAFLEESLEDLSDGTTDLVATALLSYPQEPIDLLLKIESLANLDQTAELKRWFRRLPEDLKNWIVGDEYE